VKAVQAAAAREHRHDDESVQAFQRRGRLGAGQGSGYDPKSPAAGAFRHRRTPRPLLCTDVHEKKAGFGCKLNENYGGRYRIRTCDFHRVKMALYR
jgi:hypothetical protein